MIEKMSKKMKGIIVEDCLSCPFSNFKNTQNDGGILICELGKSFGKGIALITKMSKGDWQIPNWCRLTDLEEVVEIAAYDYNVVCENIFFV